MITVLGSINLDQIGTVSRLPLPGETVAGSTHETAAGGKGANQALAAQRAGATVMMVGAVGTDAFADLALANLVEAGVQITGVEQVPGATGIAMILVDASGQNVIAVLPGANGRLGETRAEVALAQTGEGSLLLLQQEIPNAVTRRALEIARVRGIRSILNTAPFLRDTAELAQMSSIVVANESEFMQLSEGRDPTAETMRTWVADRDQTLIVTLGERGVRAVHGEEVIEVPALAISPVDTVGAGDTFVGYLAAGLDAGLQLRAALARAAAAASLACLRSGAQPAIPTAAEVDAVWATTTSGP